LFPSHKNLKEEKVIYSLGTSHRSLDQFLTLFQEHQIKAGVDIRSFPSSRYPHFSKDALSQHLEDQGIRYINLGEELGGFRKGGYLHYMASDSFRRGLEKLEEIALERRTGFFCSERFPWRCHRRWVSQELAQRGWLVIHIIEEGKVWIPKPGVRK